MLVMQVRKDEGSVTDWKHTTVRKCNEERRLADAVQGCQSEQVRLPLTGFHAAYCACNHQRVLLSRYGLKQRRLIAISPLQFGYLLNFDVHMRLRRRLPLEQLIQVCFVCPGCDTPPCNRLAICCRSTKIEPMLVVLTSISHRTVRARAFVLVAARFLTCVVTVSSISITICPSADGQSGPEDGYRGALGFGDSLPVAV